MPATRRDITELITMIMATTVGLTVHEATAEPAATADQPTVGGMVFITGTWQGSVLLHVSTPLAARCAARMFDLGDTAPTAPDIREAVAELVNMTGGAIKALLSESDARLSLPIVSQAGEDPLPAAIGAHTRRFEYVCDGEPLAITIAARGGEHPAT